MACSALTIQIITVGTISRSRLASKTQVTNRPLTTLMLKTAMLPFLWELLRPGVNKKQFACSNPCRKFQYWNIIAFSTCVTNWTFRRLDSIVCSLNIIQYMVFGKLKIFDRSFLIWCDESQLAICVYGETYYSPQSGSITVPNFSAGSVSGISPGAVGVRRGALPNGDRRFGERAGQAGVLDLGNAGRWRWCWGSR